MRRGVDRTSMLDLDASRAFFRELLAGKFLPTPLPGAEPLWRPLLVDGYGDFSTASSVDLLEAIRGLAVRTKTTVETVCCLGWAIVLSRYTHDQDVVFGLGRLHRLPVAASPGEGVWDPLRSTVPIRARVSDDRRVADLLSDVEAQTVALRRHRYLSLADIESQSELTPSARLFETVLTFRRCDQNSTPHAVADPPGNVGPSEPAFPFEVTVIEADLLNIRIGFERSRFPNGSVERLAASLLFVLGELAEDEHRLLRSVQVVPTEERHRIAVDWNDTDHPFSDGVLIHEPFEARATSQPNAIAVEMDGRAVTYGELERRSNRLAHELRQSGAGPGRFVGICLDRGISLVVALLAVSKSGSAYLPLDPSYPANRLTFMLSDARAFLVLTEQPYQQIFSTATLCLDAGGEHHRNVPGDRLERLASSADACYAIYTSGSTGSPNGVILSHRAVVNTLEWVNRTFALGSDDRLLFVNSPCFDLSVYDVFGVLGAGATVVIASDRLLADPVALAGALIEKRITVWNSAPAGISRLMAFLSSRLEPPCLRLVMLSGDWIPLTLPNEIRRVFPAIHIVALGGATEAAIWSNWCSIEQLDPRWLSIPYGTPIQNCRYHVLDSAQRVVPVGVSGDLYIGGACLAEGYLNRPELTRERFIRDPLNPDSPERLYKTGDLARYFDNGQLELLGRGDLQVKIRGFRIELIEVEAALTAIEGVKNGVCAAYEDTAGQKALAAYVVPTSGSQLDPSNIRSQLRKVLPGFMVPTQVVILPGLPISNHGKIDRQSLPRPPERLLSTAAIPAKTELEGQMVAIWERLLDKRPIGTTDDFFDLGAHSLQAVALVAEVKDRLGLDLPLEHLLENPTVEAITRYLSRSSTSEAARRPILTFNAGGGRPQLVLFPDIHGASMSFRSFPALFGPDQPVHLAQPVGGESSDKLSANTIEGIADAYEAAVADIGSAGPVILGGFSFGSLVAFELVNRLRRRGRAVPLVICLDGYAPGYPAFLPWPRRMWAHFEQMRNGNSDERRHYFEDRLTTFSLRVRRVLGTEYKSFPHGLSMTPEVRQRVTRLWRINTEAAMRYRPAVAPKCPMLLIRAQSPPRWVGITKLDPFHGWASYITDPISVVTVPGDHAQLLRRSNQIAIVDAMAEHIRPLRKRLSGD